MIAVMETLIQADSTGNWYFFKSSGFYLGDGPYYLVLPEKRGVCP